MKVSDFKYDLPEELIAQVPIENRDTSRLMILDRKKQKIEHKTFKDILDYLQPGDCLVRNITKVIPARLYGIKEETGIQVEFLLLNRLKESFKTCKETNMFSNNPNKIKGANDSESSVKNIKYENEEIWEVMVRPRKTFKTRHEGNV